MQEAIENWNAPGVSSMWFDETKFESVEHFDPDHYVDDLKRYIPLETLKDRLLEYTEDMRGRLVELVNEDYDEFAALSTKLVNVEAAVTELEKPVFAVKEEIEQVRHKLLSHSTALKEAVQRRQQVAELKKSLQTARSAAQSLSNVEKLVQALESDNADLVRKNSSNSHEELCKSLDRICSELGRLLYVLKSNNTVQAMTGMIDHVEALRAKVESKLETALIQILEEQDPVSFGTLLHAFSTIGNVSTPESIVRNYVIAPCVRSVQGDGETKASVMLHKIVRYMKEDVWQFLEVATSTCSTSLPYDFLGQSVFPEVVGAVEALYPAMYSPGNPVAFQETYAALEEFILDLERLCVSKDQVIRFKSSASYKDNKAKWNFAAYFSLCFQDIASMYEQKLSRPEQFFDTSEGQELEICTRCTVDLVSSMQACLDDSVFLLPVADKLIRLQLQMISRFIAWLESLEKYAYSCEDLSPSAPRLMALLYGSVCSTSITEAVMPFVENRLKDVEIVNLIEYSYRESEMFLRDKANSLLEIASAKIAATCIEYLGQIRGIVAAFRMTARKPTAAAQYSFMILKALENFAKDLADVPALNVRSFSVMVINKIAERYCQVARETLETSRRTEESLKKLKSRKGAAITSNDSSSSMTTDQMVAIQLDLDVKEFVNRVASVLEISPRDVFEQVPEAQKLYDTVVMTR